MIRTIWKLAAAGSWRGSSSDRARAIAVAVSAGLLTLIAIGALSCWSSASRINERAHARNFTPASAPGDVSYERTVEYDEGPDGHEILVVRWRPRPAAPPLPGLPTDPVPGWYLSPALHRAVSDDPVLAARYPRAEQIGASGVARADEFVAYEIVGSGSPLVEQLTSIPSSYLGNAAELEVFPIVLVAGGLLLVPGLALLRAGAAIRASNARRAAVALRNLGASTATIRGVGVASGFVTTLPGALTAAGAWSWMSPRLTRIPIVDRPVLRGDLANQSLANIAIALTVAGAAGAVSAIGRSEATRRRRLRRRWSFSVEMVALALGTVCFSAVIGGTLAPKLFLIGVVLLAAGMPGSLAAALRAVGRTLADRHRWRAGRLLLGRSLSLNAQRTAMSQAAAMTVIAVVPVLAAWVQVARQVDRPDVDGVYMFRVDDDPENLTADAIIDSDLGAVVQTATDETTGVQTVFALNCDTLGALYESIPCTSSLNPGEQGRRIPAPDLQRAVAGYPDTGRVVTTRILTEHPIETEAALRDVLRTAPTIRLVVPDTSSESPLVAWILGAATLTLIIATVTLALNLISGAARTAQARARLGIIGTPRNVLQRFVGTEVAVTLIAATLISLTAALGLTVVFTAIEPAASIPWSVIGYTGSAGIVVSMLTAMLAAFAVPPAEEFWSERNHTGW